MGRIKNDILANPIQIKKGLSREAAKKSLPLWSPVETIPNTTRSKINVISLECVVFDFDQAKNASPSEIVLIGEIEEKLKAQGVEAFIHETASSTPEKPKCRAVLPLLHPVAKDIWLWYLERTIIQLGFDSQRFRAAMDLAATKDVARAWYRPGCHRGENIKLIHLSGDFFELAPTSSTAISATNAESGSEKKSRKKSSVVLNDADEGVLRHARKIAREHPPAISGCGGHATTFNLALDLVKGLRLSAGQALRLMKEEFNLRCEPPWSDEELEHKVEDANDASKVPSGYLLADAPRGRKSCQIDTTTSSPTEGYEFLKDIVPNAPGNPRIPPGWVVTQDGGIQRVNRRGNPVGIGIPRGSFLFKHLMDLSTGLVSLEVGFLLRGSWKHVVAPRSVFKDRTALTRLADTGLPVAGHTAPVLIQFLDEQEAVNEDTLPVHFMTKSLGWLLVNGKPHFQANATTTLGMGASHSIQFKGADPGEQQIASAPKSAGNHKSWQEAILALDGLVGPTLAIHASLASALIEPLASSTSSFMVSYECRTSAGKTTTLLFGASVWGAPVETGPHSLMVNFDSTQVGLERRLAVHRSIPLFIDDTKRAKDVRQIGEVPYLVAQGQGRGRGNKQGVDVPRTWALVALMSGEASVSAYTTSGGANARVLFYRKRPFGEESPRMARLIADVRAVLMENHGHAGPMFAEELLKEFQRDQWKGLKERHRILVESYAQESQSGAVQRMAAYAATVHLAGELATEWGILPPPFREPMREAWRDILAEAEDPAGERRAFLSVIDWARANPMRFHSFTPGKPIDSREPPAQGIAGFWLYRRPGSKPYGVGFYPHVLKEVLRGLGYDPPEAIWNGWADTGLIHPGEAEPTGKRRLAKKVRMRDEVFRLIVLDLAKTTEEDEQQVEAPSGHDWEGLELRVGTPSMGEIL